METLRPDWLTVRAARRTSSGAVPATKRLESLRPREERSATARSERLPEREIKIALSTAFLRDYTERSEA
jgi:hypothetical protein